MKHFRNNFVLARIVHRTLSSLLSILLIPGSVTDLFAQPTPAPSDAGEMQSLAPDQLDQLVAPIALYPDALIAQVLAASTYPVEIVDAERWMRSHPGLTASRMASKVNEETWDPSVKALTAFPSVLERMDRNLDWTTNLGDAYYNQPQDVMDAIQTMRRRAQSSGTLASTPQQTVSTVNGDVVIAPADPAFVYVPAYNPWIVYGAPLAVYPGFYYAPPPGVVFGAGLAIGFGVGIGIGAFAPWGWGWNTWRLGWHSRTVIFNHTRYYTHSRSVINRGFGRPGGPGGRSAFRQARAGGFRGSFNRVRPQRAFRGRAGFHSRGGFHAAPDFRGPRR